MARLGPALRRWNRRRIARKRDAWGRNEIATRSVAGTPHDWDTPLVVSLTSYPPRFSTLALTLQCLIQQTVTPDRVVLWIAHDDLEALPPEVLALKAQGLEISGCEDTRSYKKIIPALAAFPEATIVTADDDVHYAADWLSGILTQAAAPEVTVGAVRALDLGRLPDGGVAPYADWQHLESGPKRGTTVFPTGVCGVLYRPCCFDAEVHDMARAQELCPSADDIWLYWMHRLAGGESLAFGKRKSIVNWDTGGPDLHAINVLGGQNDVQIAQMVARYGAPF
ncbi:MAG: glycosyltransferase family 2 protein [Pseudomonadota bacterium]